MQNKIVLVTGANSGIGKVTALELARQGAQVVMVVRSAERGQKAQADIINASGSDKVDLMLADLSSQADIRRLAQDFKANYERLDVLINNAGAIFMSRQDSVDGIEKTFALNHLGYFLLTDQLLDIIQATDSARIVNVASAAHVGQSLNFDDLQNKSSYSGMRVYGESKLANILFTYALNKRLKGSNVTTNALHPGFVATNFAKNNGFMARIAMGILGPIAGKSPQKGAETSIYLASSPEVANISGKYFVDKKAVSSSPQSYDETSMERLWEASEELTKMAFSV